MRHHDQEEQQTDAAVHWDTIRPKLLRAFADRGARDFSEKDWLRHTHEELTRRGSSMARIAKIIHLLSSNPRTHWWNYNCAWVGGARFNSLRLERVCVPQSLFLQNLLYPWERTHCRRKTKQGMTTDHLLHTLNPFGADPDEEAPSDDFTMPKKVHDHSNWKHDQDSAYWGKIVPSTRSRISVLADEIECNHRTQSCAGELHLQGNFSKRTSDTVRKNLNPSTCAKGDTWVQLAITAAATLW